MASSSSSSLSLESLLKSSRIQVAEDDVTLVIDRNQYASRKRNRLCTVTSAGTAVDTNTIRQELESNVDLNTEAIFWQQKYESLVAERIDAERDFDKQLHVVDQIAIRKDAYIKLLEKKIEKISNDNGNNHDDYELRLKNKVISFYEKMTCMSVKVDNDDRSEESKYTCTIKNKQRRAASRFVISIDDKTKKSATNIKYTPCANVLVLPDYLHNTIEFEPGMAPVLLGDVLNSMFEDA